MARESIEIDTSEVRELAMDLRRAPGRLQRSAPATLRKGAVKIKRGMKRDFANARGVGGHRGYYPHLAAAIDYDEITPWNYEIGIDKDAEQGALGNIIAFGTANNAPVVDHTAALRREVPLILQHLGDDAEDAVLDEVGKYGTVMRRYPMPRGS